MGSFPSGWGKPRSPGQGFLTTRPQTQVVLMTAFGGIDIAVEAIKAGALVRKALTERDLRRENRDLRQAVEARYSFGKLLGKSATRYAVPR
jgi:hypothetical protein